MCAHVYLCVCAHACLSIRCTPPHLYHHNIFTHNFNNSLHVQHLEHVSGEASPLTPRNKSPKKIQFPNERMLGGHLTVNTGDNLPERLAGPILPLKSAVRTVVPVPALKMQTYTERKDWPCGQSTTFASSPRSIEYAEYQKAFRGGSHQGSSSSLMSGIGGTGPGPRHTPMDPRVAWKESAQSSGRESSSTSGKDLFSTQSSKEYSPSSSQSKEYSPSSSQSKEYSPSSSQSKEYSPSSSQSAKEYSPSSSTQSGKESSPSYSPLIQSGKDSSATQSGKDSSDDSSTKPAPRRPGGFPPSPPTTVSRKPHIMNMGLGTGTETKSCNSSGSGSGSCSSSSSSSSSTSSSSASAVSYIASGSSMKESSIVSGLNSSTGGYALTSSSSSSTGTSYTYNNGSIFSANSNITSGSFSTTATTATTSTYAGNHAGFSSIAHGIIGNSLQSNVTSMLNSSMSSNTSTNSSNSPRYTGSPRSTTSSSSLRCSLATATAILMGIGAGARPSTPRKYVIIFVLDLFTSILSFI